MEYRFISKLYYFNLESKLNKGIQVLENVRISNSNFRVESLFGDPFFQVLIGKLEYDALLDSSFIYATGNLNSQPDESERLDIIDQYLRISQHFCSGLWLVKDNSVNNESGFLYINSDDSQSASSNMRTSLFLNSYGEYAETNFSEEEVKTAIKIMNSIFENTAEDIREIKDNRSMLYNKTTRIERFNYFLQVARAQEHLPSRITLYCSYLKLCYRRIQVRLPIKLLKELLKF